MSGQQIGTVIGGAIGAYFGGPAGAQLGMAIGGTIGGIVDPTHINGPKIGDGQQQAATDGNPIAWVQGTAMVAGTIVQVSSRRQVRHKDSGKGGPVQVTYTAVQDFAILVCESSELRDSAMSSVLMVIQDGKLVYDVRPGSAMLAASLKWKANVDFLFGGEDQLPHPTMEAITGVGNTPAYRGSCIAVFKNFDVSTPGDRIPNFQFVVCSSSATPITPPVQLSSGGVGVNLSSGQCYLNYNSGDDPLTVPSSGEVNLTVDPPHAPGSLVNHSRRFVISVTGGALVWDTGWVGDAANQMQLDTALTSAGHPELMGAILNGTTTSRIVRLPAGAASLNYTIHMVGSPLADGNASMISASAWTVPPIPVTSPLSVGLDAIARAIALRGGLSDSDIDVSLLGGIQVSGYPIARQATAADCLLPLMQAYFGFASEFDAKLHFKLYGEDAEVTIDRADLIEGNDATNGAIVNNLRNQATEFPRRVVASYMDPVQNYSVVDVAAERRAIDVIAIGDQSFAIPVVMAADDAAKAADKALKVAYATLEGTQEYSTPFAGSDVYISLAAGEPLLFQGKRYVLDEMMIGNGSLKLTTRYDRQSAYTSNVQPILGNAPVPPASPYSGPTTLIPMNLPSLRPQDTYGVYLAAASADGSPSWAGCTVQVSYDGQASWQNALQITQPSVFGVLDTAEPVGGEPLTVLVNGDLESVTTAQLAAQANAFALIHVAAGTTEVGQFQTATATGTTDEYALTTVARGQLGTTRAAGAVNDPFVMLDAVYFLAIDISFAGKTLYFRTVGFGETDPDAPVSLSYNPDTTTILNGGTFGS